MNKLTCWVLAGPTASGKTDISLRLAETYGCEIICMDSMQIYRGLDIGTAKPTTEEQARAPHHMLDIVEPWESFSVAQYQEMAEKIASEIFARGKQPLFVGGTGFYLRALRHPMVMGDVTGDQQIRDELQQLADGPDGREKLHKMLAEVDPVTAARLHLNDVRRAIRALEVYQLTGKPFSQQENPTVEPHFRYRVAMLEMDRSVLYQRVEKRVDLMIDAGLEQEIRGLLARGIPETSQSLKAIGYKEMIPYIHGEYDLEKAIYEIKLNTRHYAKRQLTWMRAEEDVYRADGLSADRYEQIKNWFTEARQ